MSLVSPLHFFNDIKAAVDDKLVEVSCLLGEVCLAISTLLGCAKLVLKLRVVLRANNSKIVGHGERKLRSTTGRKRRVRNGQSLAWYWPLGVSIVITAAVFELMLDRSQEADNCFTVFVVVAVVNYMKDKSLSQSQGSVRSVDNLFRC